MNFSFAIITYNHEKYILEHLESIKYQIVEYGENYKIQLIVADDGSRDRTVNLVEEWIAVNRSLFEEVTILADKNNRGTCYNYTKIWEHITGEYCKITAGDDVYSFVNLFTELKYLDSYQIVSGLPLLLVNERILPTASDIFHTAATEVIYKNMNYSDRLKTINVANAPNIFIQRRVFENIEILKFIRSFSVTEDFPLHIKMAEAYSPLKHLQLNKVIVYYRRTNNSTYLIKNCEFNADKVELYKYLIQKEKNIVKKILLKNRSICFRMGNRVFSILFDFNYYIYFVRLLVNIFQILEYRNNLKIELTNHKIYYKKIRLRVSKYLENSAIVKTPLENRGCYQ